eukprot:463653_1
MGKCCSDAINHEEISESENKNFMLDPTHLSKCPLIFSSNICCTPANLNDVLNEILTNIYNINKDFSNIILIIKTYLDFLEISNVPYSNTLYCYYCHDQLFQEPFSHIYFKRLNLNFTNNKLLKIAVIGDYWSQPDYNITSNLFKNKFESSWDPYVCDDYMISISIDKSDKLCINPINEQSSMNNDMFSCVVSSITMTEFKGKPIHHKMRNESEHIKKLMTEKYIKSYVNNINRIYDIYMVYCSGSKTESFENTKLMYQCIKQNKQLKDKFCCLVSTIGHNYERNKYALQFSKQEGICCFVINECTNVAVLDLMEHILMEYCYQSFQ